MIDYTYHEHINIGTNRSGDHWVYPCDIYRNRHNTHEKRWQFREFARIHTGVYKRIPSVVRERLREELPKAAYEACYQVHFPHMSITQPGMVAYTESITKGERDIQSVTKIGRFLTRVLGITDQKVIKSISESMTLATGHDHAEATVVHFAEDPSDIAEIYMHSGIDSCMDKKRGYWSTGGTHPVEAYHPEDFKLAYLKDCNGEITARSLVTREDVYIRTYPEGATAAAELAAALQAKGYRHNRNGAQGMRLQRIEYRDGFVGPYIDGDECDIYDDGEVLWIGRYPSGKSCYCVGNSQEAYDSDGLIQGGNRTECHECGSFYDPEEMTAVDSWGEELVCESCCEYYWCYSEHSDEWIRRDEAVHIDDRSVWVRDDEAVPLYSGGYGIESDCIELHDNQWAWDDDPEVVELDNGDFALLEDAVETIDAGWQLAEVCIENSDGDWVLHDDENEDQLAMEV